VGQLPLVAGGRVFLGQRSGTVRAFAEDDGAELWSFEAGEGSGMSLLLADDGLLIERDGELIRVDPADGKELDRHPSPEFDLTSAVVEAGLIVGSSGQEANAIYVAMSRDREVELWRREGGIQRDPITLASGAVCLRTGMHAIAAWELESGSTRWELDVGEIGSYTDDGHPMRGEPAGAGIAVDKIIYLGVVGYRVLAIEASSGEVLWQKQTPILNVANLVYDPVGTLHLLDSQHYVALDAGSGDVITEVDFGQRLQVDSHIVLPTALDVGVEHILGADFYGTVFALNKSSHAVDWSERLRSRIPLQNYPVAVGDHLYVLDSADNLHVFGRAQ